MKNNSKSAPAKLTKVSSFKRQIIINGMFTLDYHELEEKLENLFGVHSELGTFPNSLKTGNLAKLVRLEKALCVKTAGNK